AAAMQTIARWKNGTSVNDWLIMETAYSLADMRLEVFKARRRFYGTSAVGKTLAWGKDEIGVGSCDQPFKNIFLQVSARSRRAEDGPSSVHC
ncbi:MAG TPA: hypothetical protein VGN79_11580, partial [Devosia sp.]|nr:hypothetical protein [Devosia sp.]